MSQKLIILLAAAGLFLSSPASAEMVYSDANGFSVRHAADISSTDQQVFTALTTRIAEWWHPDHSWSGNASNLYFDATLGGCFCERMPNDGGVEHLRVIFLKPPTEIRTKGALGPLQSMGVNGTMIWKIEETPGTDASPTRQLVFQYTVQGYVDGGLKAIAPAVDGVIGQQHQRFIELLEGS